MARLNVDRKKAMGLHLKPHPAKGPKHDKVKPFHRSQTLNAERYRSGTFFAQSNNKLQGSENLKTQ